MGFSKSDIDIINDVLAGSKEDFRLLYDRYSRNHLLTCLRYVSNRSDAEDMLQESYIKIYRDLKQFDPNRAKYITWSNRIVINTCLMKLRKRNIFTSLKNLIGTKNEVKIRATAIDELSLQDLTNLIAQLPKGYRTVFNMFVIDGFSHQEIAQELNISVSTSKTQLRKAKKALQNHLKPKDISVLVNYAKG